MATAQSIRDQLDALNDHVLELETFAKIGVDLAGDNLDAPQWPWLVWQFVERIQAASEALEATLRTKALPVLEDMDSVLRG